MAEQVAVIVDHVFRRALYERPTTRRNGHYGGPIVAAGTCWYLTSCGRPASEHITPSDYRARRKARPAALAMRMWSP